MGPAEIGMCHSAFNQAKTKVLKVIVEQSTKIQGIAALVHVIGQGLWSSLDSAVLNFACACYGEIRMFCASKACSKSLAEDLASKPWTLNMLGQVHPKLAQFHKVFISSQHMVSIVTLRYT